MGALLKHQLLLVCLLVCLPMGTISCRPDLTNFNEAEKKKITSEVWLHRTSRDTVSIADKDGMALVYGNVVRLDYVKGSKDILLVAYEPFSSSAQNTNSATVTDLKISKIDLRSAQVTPVPDPDGVIGKTLKLVDAFSP